MGGRKGRKMSADERIREWMERHVRPAPPLVRVRKGTARPARPVSAAPAPQPAPPRTVTPRFDDLPDEAPPAPRFEPAPRGRVIRSAEGAAAPREIPCAVCGARFDPDHPAHRGGRRDECGPCGADSETEPRVQGQMEWFHKSVAVLRIAGRPDPTTPEEKAKMRRRP